ncbi:glycosyltransferase family 2 protein [Halomonas citrativorans]|uniref:Glycosyltransferase n=1 Tax=Halomonas citrativorans TaxID=2742612 RepID=A0ABR9FGN6_9GAMM|nr:hypothetical protein [Halomonas citrativorans]MBE0404480.1 hypothetical protein [Halomonas citrativorans]
MKISVVIVLYKKEASESRSLSSIMSAMPLIAEAGFELTIFVWNNSPDFCEEFKHPNIIWLEENNAHLPFVYNSVAEKAFTSGSDLLMISDDDSDYSQFDFLELATVAREIVLEKQCKEKAGCIIPQVFSKRALVSPGRRLLFKGNLIRSVSSGFLKTKNTVGINSGIVVTRECYNRLSPLYNEQLFFYGTDTDFFYRYEKEFSYLYVLNSRIQHSLSENTNESIERALFRWSDHFYATRTTFKRSHFFVKILLHLYICYMRVKLSMKYKSKKFLKV